MTPFRIRIYPVRRPDLEVILTGGDPFAAGCVVGPDGFRGWNGGTPKRRNINLRQNRRGAHRARGYDNPRTVSIDGWANAATLLELGDLEEKFGYLDRDDVDEVMFIVEEMGRTRWAVGAMDFAGFQPDGTDPTAELTLEIWFADSVKFGDRRKLPAVPATSSTVQQYGNTTSALVHTITGESSTGYTLASGGRTYQVTEPLVAGTPHVVDMDTGELSINGVVIHGKTNASDLWGCPAAGTVTTTVTGGSALVRTETIDTYST